MKKFDKYLIILAFLFIPFYLKGHTNFHFFNSLKSALIILFSLLNVKKYKFDFKFSLIVIYFIINLFFSSYRLNSLFYIITGLLPLLLLIYCNLDDRTANLIYTSFIFSSFIAGLLFIILPQNNSILILDKNIVSFNLVISIFILLKSKLNILISMTCLIFFIIVFITSSYGGIISSLLLFSYIQLKKISGKFKYIFMIIVLALVLFILYEYKINASNRLKSRVFVYFHSMTNIKQNNIFFGNGLFSSRNILKSIENNKNLPFFKEFMKTNKKIISHTHNFFIQHLLEEGMFGMLLWIFIYIQIIKNTRDLTRVFFIIIFLWLQFDYFFYIPTEILIFGIICNKLSRRS